MHRILVFSMTRMGDIIQSIPFLQHLRLRYPESRIDLLVEECFADVAGFVPGIDRIIRVRLEDLLPCLSTGSQQNLAEGLTYYSGLIRELSESAYDQVWNLTHTRPLTVLTGLIGGESAHGVTLDGHGLQRVNVPWLRYFFATNLARPWCQFNLVDIYANCIEPLELPVNRSLQIDSEHYREHRPVSLPPRTRVPRIAVHPGASQRAKQWSVRRFASVCRALTEIGHEVILVGGPGDRKLAECFPRHPSVTNLIGGTTPTQLAATLAECDVLVSNDSGPMHVAAAVGTCAIAITLGSALGTETAPYGEGHWVVEPDLDCFPCSAQKACPTQLCAERIEPELIVGICRHILEGAEPAVPPECGANVYRTIRHAQDGMLALEPVGSRRTRIRDRIHELTRPLWLRWLSGVHLQDSGESLERLCPQAARAANQAGTLAAAAARLCDELSEIGAAAAGPRLRRLTQNLENADQQLQDLLSYPGVLQSLHAHLRIEKSSISGDDLTSQARGTADVYRGLHTMLAGLNPQGSTLRNPLNKDTRRKEVHHANLGERNRFAEIS